MAVSGVERAGRGRLGVNFFVIVATWLVLSANSAFGGERLTLNFNSDWKFVKADPTGAAELKFDDRGWTNVSAPHTFNDTDTFDDWSLSGHRGEQDQWSGRTWYRKTLTAPESFKGKRVFIEFEAVRQVAEVYLNGKLLGTHKTGFTPFGFDLTPHLHFDSPNVLAVMCDNRFMKDPWAADGAGELPGGQENGTNRVAGGKLAQLAAHFNATIPDTMEELQADQIPWNNPHWHPAHGGIYRNVYLHVTDPLHISLPLYSFLQTAGPYVYTTDVSRESATVCLVVPIENGRAIDEKVELRAEVFDHDGKSVLAIRESGEVAAGQNREFPMPGRLKKPRLWDIGYPHVYRVVCSVRVKGEMVDTAEIPLGIRAARWDLQTGFYLNQRHLKLHGWGQKPTDEWPGLGAAQPDWVHYFTMQLMKDAGGNMVRWGHSAGGPASVKAADQLGLVTVQPGVDGESDTRGGAWTLRAAAFRDTIIYFRNNPSILVWEGGNQKVTHEHAQELRAIMDKYDPQGGRVYAHRRADKITAEFMGIGIGTEGGREIAELPVLEGEYNREESPRRVWDNQSPPKFGYPEAKGQTYQLTSEQYAVNQVAHYLRKLGASEHSGGANWIFSDSTSGGRVACEVARTSGEVDGVRLPKEAYFACRAMFRADPQVHIIGHWTYPAGTKKDINVVGNGEEVELFVNGKSQGRGRVTDRYLFHFPEIVWEAGEIKAVSCVDGKPVATQIKRTAGAPASLRLTSITGPAGLEADGADVAFIDVEVVDAKGERCPTFEQPVRFRVNGPAQWLGGYESGRTNSVHQSQLNLECGINRVAIRAGRTAGDIKVVAQCDGLPPAEITIPSRAVEVANSFSATLPQLPRVTLPASGFDTAAADTMPPISKERHVSLAPTGRFTRAFSYSGPSSTVRVELDVQPGKRIYADREYRFPQLQEALRGGDHIQAANADKNFNAVDLMELSVKGGSAVFLAHDDRLPRPDWLTRQFSATDQSLTVEGRPMKIFQRRVAKDESLTLGANAENAMFKSCNMYVVIVNAATTMLAERSEERGR